MRELRRFSVGTEILAGLGVIETLHANVAALEISKPALVCDQGLLRTGLLDGVLEQLGGALVAAPISVAPEPTIEAAEKAACVARGAEADGVVAVGGGSGLAVGKAVAAGLANHVPLATLAGRDRARIRAAPVLAIPTTAGSGSEVSSVFVLQDPARPAAVVFQARHYAPRIALLDGDFLRSLPREPMLYAALDALSHCLEALWARGASTFSDALATRAAGQIHEMLPPALDGRDSHSLQMLLEASAMANLACGNSGLALVHALSLASCVQLPHGYQNGVLLPSVAAFNRSAVGHQTQAEIDRLGDLYERIGFAGEFREHDLDRGQTEDMIAVALASPLRDNNVREASEADVRRILAQAMPG